MISTLRDMRWTMVLSVVIGVLLALAVPAPMTMLYDAVFPVVTMNSRVVSTSPTEITIGLHGTKNRDCKYLSINAFSRVGERLQDVNIQRVDKTEEAQTRPIGEYDFGVWRLWPTRAGQQIEVYVQYSCSGRDTFVRVAEVKA